jgi:hypothetical protein
VVNFTLRQLHPEGKCPGTYYVGGWVESRAGVDVVEKRKAENQTQAIQPVAISYTY